MFMTKIFFLLIVFVNTLVFSQQYSFVSKNAVAIDKWTLIDILNKIPKPEIDNRFEN